MGSHFVCFMYNQSPCNGLKKTLENYFLTSKNRLFVKLFNLLPYIYNT